jgi:nucleoid DNA-binding protein
MTRADLVAVMARATGGSKAASERALAALLDTVLDDLRKGRRVSIGGFGTFMVVRRAGRNGRNPRTGKAIHIPPTRVPRFRPSRAFKAALM